MQLDIGLLLQVLVVPAWQELAASQAEQRLLGPKKQHLLLLEQQQHTHTEAQAGPQGTGHSIGRSGCTSHDTAEMSSMECSGHAVPAEHSQTLVAQVSSEVTAK